MVLIEGINRNENTDRKVLWKSGVLEQWCTGNTKTNPWKILLRQFTANVTGDTALNKYNFIIKMK